MAQFSYNSSLSETTKTTPFEANLGYTLVAYREPLSSSRTAHYADIDFKLLKWLHKQLTKDIRFYVERVAHYYNRSHLEGPRFKEGDRVYLSRRNIKTTRLLNKLDYKKIRPF